MRTVERIRFSKSDDIVFATSYHQFSDMRERTPHEVIDQSIHRGHSPDGINHQHGQHTMTEILSQIMNRENITLIGGLIGGSITIYIYYRNSQLQRAQWLYNLFKKFFFQTRYAEIRRILDYDDEDHIQKISQCVTEHTNPEIEENLVDYLNFFEFIAILWKLGQLSLNEATMMFEYHITKLDEHKFINNYLKNEGFEGLIELIAAIKSRKPHKNAS